MAEPSAPSTRGLHAGEPLIQPAFVYGFGTAVAVWCTWFATHLPWAGIPERVSIPILLLVWLAGAILAGAAAKPGHGWKVGALAGVITALVGLLVLGSKLTEPPAAGANAAGAVKPNAALIAGGFLLLGLVLGGIGGAAGNLMPRRTMAQATWLGRFALVACAAVAPLLFVGGLVTSTGSGMAVPDWPGTFGSSMFLYPLGPRSRPDVYLEHSHRLFGTLIGLTSIVLMVWVLLGDRRGWLRTLAVAAFLLIVVQGLLGAFRVIEDQRVAGLVHGVLAQIILGMLVAIAVGLSPRWRTSGGRCVCGYDPRALPSNDGSVTCPECGRFAPTPEPIELNTMVRRARFFATGALHATVIQLILGAAYRHFSSGKGSMHTLWTHVAFSFVVVLFALAAGFLLASLKNSYAGIGPILKRTGVLLLVVVALQFILGWGAFAFIGPRDAEKIAPALVRTAHQANGALLLAAALLAAMWTKRLNRIARAA
jgi:cytochrome c oxidase assembly protein subunit 15